MAPDSTAPARATTDTQAPIRRVDEPLHDYGKLHTGGAAHECCRPDSIEQVRQIVRECAATGRGIRVRGSGHTFNGCTLPRGNELLLRTERLDRYAFGQRGSVDVGAGALLWDVRDLAGDHALVLPVYNGGWAGPTVGGYACAGGFGKGSLSDAHGGFWENVLELTLVDAAGEVHVIGRDDPRFPWLFGSYGQLGVLVAAKLRLVAAHPLAMLAYPMGEEGRVPRRQQDDPALNDRPDPPGSSKLFWFSLLVSPGQEEQAWEETLAFCRRHAERLHPEGGWAGPSLDGEPIGYRYNVRFHTFTPPLLYDRDEDFLVMGVMCRFDRQSVLERSGILAIEEDFLGYARRCGFRLYLQAENIGGSVDHRDYHGEAVHAHLAALRRELDPRGLINAGVVFADERSRRARGG